MKKGLLKFGIIIVCLSLLVIIMLLFEILPYRVYKATGITQHPVSDYPSTEYSYDISFLGIPLVAESQVQILCNEFDAYGKLAIIRLNNKERSLQKNYFGAHLIINKFICK